MAKQDEVCQLRQIIQDHQDKAGSNKAAHQTQLQVLEKQVDELREIIGSSMHTKRASMLKLETAMNALNLSKGDARRFIEVCLLRSGFCDNCPWFHTRYGCIMCQSCLVLTRLTL